MQAGDTLGERLRELHRRALELVGRMREEEEKAIRELVETSHKMTYLGYVPAVYRYTSHPRSPYTR